MMIRVFTVKYRRIIQITVYIFLLLLFLVILFANWCSAGNPVINETKEVQKSFIQIVTSNVPNIFTLVGGAVAVLAIVIVDKKTGKVNALKVIVFSVVFAGLWLGTVFAQEYNVSSATISLIAMIIITILGMIIILPRHPQYTDDESIKLRRMFKGIVQTNNKVASIQLYDVFGLQNDIYSIKFRSSYTQNNFDINAILNQTLSFNQEDLQGLQGIIEKYNEFLIKIRNQGVTARSNRVQAALKKYIDKNWVPPIQKDLYSIDNADNIDQEHCLRAALYLFVKAIEKAMENPYGDSPDILSHGDIFYGDDFKNIDLPINQNCNDYININHKLRHMLRTGLAISTVIDDSYSFCFPYENDGYKKGRYYCVFNIDNLKPTGKGYMSSICLIALNNIEPDTRMLNDESLINTISHIEERIRASFK